MSNDNLVLFFLEGPNVPASRFRVLQYQRQIEATPHLSYKFLYTWPNKYLWAPKGLKPGIVRSFLLASELLLVVFQRLVQIIYYAPKAKIIFFQRDLLYRVQTSFLERLVFTLAPSAKVVFDLDDAIFIAKDGSNSQAIATKLAAILARVDLVIVSNQFLFEQLKKISGKSQIEIIPTVIDTQRFLPATSESHNQPPIICWSGVATNLHYLQELKSVFAELEKRCKFTLRIVAQAGTANPFADCRFPVEMRSWSQANEVAALNSADIGVMPLSDDAWSRGKAGFKLLQYMACGIAAVASPVGVNAEIIDNDQVGLLASTTEQWLDCLERLIKDRELRLALGRKARERVSQSYSLIAWEKKWKALVLE